MKTMILIFLLYLGTCSGMHRVKLFKKHQTYSSVNDHVKNLGAKYGYIVNEYGAYNLPLSNFNNLAYFGSISLGEGSQAQCFQVDFDTGSSNSWFPGSQCTDPSCINHQRFDCDQSSTCRSSGFFYELKYGNGKVSGELVHDTLCFGCDGHGPCVKQQAFLISSHESYLPFYNNKYDGLVGLAYDSMAIPGTWTPFSALLANSACKEGVFAFWMNRDQSCSPGGEMTICGTDPNHYTNPLVWAPVTERKYWQFTADSISIGNKVVARNFRAIADTGTSMIAGPMNEILYLYRLIGIEYNTEAVVGIDCHQWNRLPNVTVRISGTDFTLTPENYVIRDVKEKNLCTVGFGGHNFAPDLWIFGDVFLGPVYTVFDLANHRLGFSPSKSDPDCGIKDHVPTRIPSRGICSSSPAGAIIVTLVFSLIRVITDRLRS